MLIQLLYIPATIKWFPDTAAHFSAANTKPRLIVSLWAQEMFVLKSVPSEKLKELHNTATYVHTYVYTQKCTHAHTNLWKKNRLMQYKHKSFLVTHCKNTLQELNVALERKAQCVNTNAHRGPKNTPNQTLTIQPNLTLHSRKKIVVSCLLLTNGRNLMLLYTHTHTHTHTNLTSRV
jgi:hypothetical protein